MAKLLKLRRGTTSQHSSFTGAEGEATVDTDKDTLVVHDGSQAGGRPLAREDMTNVSSATITGRLDSGSIASAKIAGDAIDGSKIADNAINSEHYTDGSIDHEHLANDIIDASNLQDNCINSEHYINGSIDHEHLANDIIDGTNIQDDVINSEHYVNGSIDTAHIADQAVDLSKLPHGTSSNNGKFLQANNGADPTFETVNTDLVSDTSPQLGGTLDCNGQDVQFKSGGGNVKILFDASEDSLEFADDSQLRLGASNDLRLYHNGTHSYVQGYNTGNFYLGNTHSNNIIFLTNNVGRWSIGGSGGELLPEANNTYDIGHPSYRVRNIYTNDLNLSNEGSSNDVDGTWGSYTIQEGAEDLFLINKRNGKKYKFNLTEVS